MEDEEIWKPIPGYEPYEVSNMGRVRRDRKVLSAFQNKARWDGLLLVNLSRHGDFVTCPVARLVAAVFIGPCPDGHVVAYRNGLRTDCRAENLEYKGPQRRGYAMTAERAERRWRRARRQ